MTQRKKAAPKRRTLYMHTLNGKPAYFDGDQLVYAGWAIMTSRMERSLSALRTRKRRSDEWRAKHGFNHVSAHSYVRVVVND